MASTRHKRSDTTPRVVAIAGPNGSGKSTSARSILQGPLDIDEFVNADTIAQGLSAFDPDRAAISAGRIMLARLRELAAARVSFAFETTLASKTFASWISDLIADGYEFHLIFLWLPSADAAVSRVADRVRRGGHHVPENTVRRRYVAGLKNFFDLYRPIAKAWRMIDNRGRITSSIAAGDVGNPPRVFNPALWAQIETSEQK